MPRFLMLVHSPVDGGELTVELVEAMNRFNEELQRAGALLALDGLLPPQTGARVTFAEGAPPVVTDGPFTEAKELVGGYWIIQAATQEEAVDWASRAPIQRGSIEIRRIGEAEDYAPEIAEAAEMSSDPPQQTRATD
jgi:hypothetical protein